MMSRISKDLAAHHSHNPSPARALSTQRSATPRAPRVAIVGAGFAGLRCADVLVRNGASVTIFEARNRVGGRVLQQRAGKYSFDMGPNFIHGTQGNPISVLADKTGSVVFDPEGGQLTFDADGNMKSQHKSRELSADMWATVADAYKYSNDDAVDIDPQRSLLDFFREKLAKRFPDDQHEIQERVNEARTWGPFVGDAVDTQSLRNFWLEECLEGETVFVASTYEKILAVVAENALKGANLKLNSSVVKVKYRSTTDSEDEVKVVLAQNEDYVFDEVVVTCPLGWLKRNKKVFSPEPPTRLSQAIDHVGYGNLEKIYLTFPSAWWLGNNSHTEQNGFFLTTTSTKSDDPTPPFVHFHHPTYHPDPESKTNELWNQSVISLAHLPESTASPTLLFYYYGRCSRYITSLIREHQLGSQEYNSILWEFLKPFVTRLPYYDPSNPDCTPATFVATQWSQDEYAGFGSYSNFQVGLVDGAEDVVCMREAGGLSEEGMGLWLAGEHTAPFVAIGTSTGAYWSGERAARKILGRYGFETVRTGDEDISGVGNGATNEGRSGNTTDGCI